jgi:hypothetical protein
MQQIYQKIKLMNEDDFDELRVTFLKNFTIGCIVGLVQK